MRRNATRARVVVALVLASALTAACGGEKEPPALVRADEVRTCLERSAAAWGEIPLSDVGGIVFGIDFGGNSAQIYVEPDVADVEQERDSIRAAEDAAGNTDPGDRVILTARGNVLVSWANTPTDEQKRIVRSCAGVA